RVENESWLSAGRIDIPQRVLKRECKIASRAKRTFVSTVDRPDHPVTLEYVSNLGHGCFAEIESLDTQIHRTVRVKYDAPHIDRCRQRGSAPGTERQRTCEHGSSALLVHDFLLGDESSVDRTRQRRDRHITASSSRMQNTCHNCNYMF